MPLAARWIPRIITALLAGAVPMLMALASAPAQSNSIRSIVLGAAAAAIAVLFIIAAERLSPAAARWSTAAAWMSARPRTAIAVASVAGTVLAVHPLLLGRSLASPNTGAAMVMYDAPPYVPGSTDALIEDGRGVDVGAMVWAIIPYTVVQRQALADGEWPLWNRYNLAGVPLWGQGQTFALDPFHVASLAIPDVVLAMDVRFVLARVLFAAGVGLVVYAMTASLGASVLMALITPFIGFYTMRLNHPAYFSLTYAPWVLLGYASLTRAGSTAASARAAVGIAVASALQLVGSTPKEGVTALAVMHLCGATAVFLAQRMDSVGMQDPGTGRSGWLAHKRWTGRLAALDRLALAAAAFVLITAPHWLVFVDGLTRAFTYYGRPGAAFVGWPQVQAFLIGPTHPGWPHPGVHGLATALAVAGLVAGGARWRRPLATGCLIALAVASAVAVGAVPASAITEVPLLGNVHHLGLALMAAAVPLVLAVAGIGAASLFDRSTARWRLAAAIAAAVLFAVALACDLPGDPHSPRRLMALYSLGGATAVVALAPLVRQAAPLAWTAAMVLSAGAAVIAGGLALDTNDPIVDRVLMQPRPRAHLEAVPPALDPVVAARDSGDPFRVAPFGLVMMPGTQALWGLEGIGGPDAVRLPWIEDLADLMGLDRTPFLWFSMVDETNVEEARGLLDLLNVRYLVSRSDNLAPGGHALPATATNRIGVVERPTAWPRAFFVDGVERHDSIFAFADRLRGARIPFVSVDRNDPVSIAAVSSLPDRATAVAPAHGYRLTVNRTSFRVTTTGPGVAALSESFVDRDFVATLDGVPVPYFRVNHAFRGVLIPAAGEWEIAFEYRPASWTLSWVLAGAGWLVIAGLAAAGWRGGVR